jgi:hypothetical protein
VVSSIRIERKRGGAHGDGAVGRTITVGRVEGEANTIVIGRAAGIAVRSITAPWSGGAAVRGNTAVRTHSTIGDGGFSEGGRDTKDIIAMGEISAMHGRLEGTVCATSIAWIASSSRGGAVVEIGGRRIERTAIKSRAIAVRIVVGLAGTNFVGLVVPLDVRIVVGSGGDRNRGELRSAIRV